MMKMRGVILAAALILASGFSLLALDDEDDKPPRPEIKVAATAIQKLADDAGKKDWAAMSRAGSEVAKNNELGYVMTVFKLRKVSLKQGVIGGVGIGKEPTKTTQDGIDAKLRSLTKTALTPVVLAKEQADLIRMAEITATVAGTAIHQCPVDTKQDKMDPAKWKVWSKDMYESSQELIKALKAKKPGDVKTAANKLYTSCNECHTAFR
jgi:hypothetical protein